MVYSLYPNRRGLLDQLELPPQTQNFFPVSKELTPDFLTIGASPKLKINDETPIASIGSCFAREIRQWLIKNEYAFIQTATGVGTGAGSARYDRVYSTFGIRQEFERAFGNFTPLVEFWEFDEEGQRHIMDPYRYTIAWETHEERIREQADHQRAVRRAFMDAEVIIMTVGQGEIWYDERDGSVFPVLPPLEVFEPEIHKFRSSTYQENLENLRRCRALLHEYNPQAHLIITTSPVPMKVTFTGENSVVANCAMKSMLRAMVDEFVRESDERVSYFPAYEIVTQLSVNPLTHDARHVTRETVDVIMQTFERLYVKVDTVAPEIDDSLWEEAMHLRSTQSWTALSALLDQVHSTHGEPELPEQRQLFADLYGEACLFTERVEEARGLLLRAYALDEDVSAPIHSHFRYTRLNYLIALHYEYDHDLTSELCIKLLSNPTVDFHLINMDLILMWLNYLKLETPQDALERCMELISEVPALETSLEINTWIEETLPLLS